ncbi:DUF6238 family protein [Streptomyces sp. G45]|uniref:DUF6238 family protein n=1 Tax=Streptomyces sp. G45 TaxID=3406627 RepID=UPI003C25CAA5
MTALTLAPTDSTPRERTTRDDIDRLHADYLDLAQRTARLGAVLDHGDYSAAGGRVRAAVAATWRASEELHAAFHNAPPRGAGPEAPLSRLCRRRMRYLAARLTRRSQK